MSAGGGMATKGDECRPGEAWRPRGLWRPEKEKRIKMEGERDWDVQLGRR